MVKQEEFAFGVGLTAFAFLLLMYLYPRVKSGKVPEIRRLAALDGIEEAVGRCAEMGQKVAMESRGGVVGRTADQGVAGFAIVGHAARLCARMGAEPVIPLTGTRGTTIPVYWSILEAAYEAEGRPEAYTNDFVTVIASGSGYSNLPAMGAFLQRENVGATLIFGNITLINPVFADIDGIAIQGTVALSNIMIVALLCDYSLLGEEMFAAGAMLSKDPMTLASLRDMDALKFVFSGGILLFLVLHLAGALPF